MNNGLENFSRPEPPYVSDKDTLIEVMKEVLDELSLESIGTLDIDEFVENPGAHRT